MREDVKKIIKKIMREEKITQTDLCVALDIKTVQQVSLVFNQQDIKLEKLLTILHACDSELIIRHKNVDYRL